MASSIVIGDAEKREDEAPTTRKEAISFTNRMLTVGELPNQYGTQSLADTENPPRVKAISVVAPSSDGYHYHFLAFEFSSDAKYCHSLSLLRVPESNSYSRDLLQATQSYDMRTYDFVSRKSVDPSICRFQLEPDSRLNP
ncbi:hypothetical protein TNCV_2364701 [Trichonephila clavipes]|nr:hypothetical protein TNCV_2364701 [Trichonephila clavipes]